MKKRKSSFPYAAVIVVLLVLAIVAAIYISKYTPSKKFVTAAELMKIYGFENESDIDKDKQAAILLQNKLSDSRAMVEDGVVYLEYNFVKDELNDRFYWDNNENLLLYTLPTDIVKVSVGSNVYEVTKTENTVDYQIVKTNGNKVYIAMDFVSQYSDIKCAYYKNPSRVCITNKWNTDVDVAKISKSVKLRKKANIKADILYTSVKKHDVTITESKGKWSYVYTDDGHFGYVENSSLKGRTTKKLQSTFKEPEYTSKRLPGKVNLAWQAVNNTVANNQLVDLVTNTRGLNVVSPQWYRITDNDGNMSCYADSAYIQRAHLIGLQVWAAIDDQSDTSDNTQIFTYTSKREKIINQLIADAIQYDIDGINVDFEYIKPEIADDYIEFIRELSVKCRINGIILSVDDKIPVPGNLYYNLKAQGETVDYVIIMAYDEHWGVASGAGSVASLPWVTSGMQTVIESVDSTKVVLGIPFYTRLFKENVDGNVTDSQTIDMDTASKTLASNGVTPWWVDECGQNYGEYTNGAGETVRIWLEDSMSIEKKLELIGQDNLAGVAAWRLGYENKDIWNTIIKYVN